MDDWIEPTDDELLELADILEPEEEILIDIETQYEHALDTYEYHQIDLLERFSIRGTRIA